jgi:hypothetical protein
MLPSGDSKVGHTRTVLSIVPTWALTIQALAYSYSVLRAQPAMWYISSWCLPGSSGPERGLMNAQPGREVGSDGHFTCRLDERLLLAGTTTVLGGELADRQIAT